MIVFDASGSMAESGYNGLTTPRIEEAREALHVVLPDVTSLRQIGLVTYGPGEFHLCDNVDLHFPPLPNAHDPILQVVDAVTPAGNTALTDAVQQAAEVLGGGAVPGTVVLVTDGKETCRGQPCMLARELAPGDITVHVIGFRVLNDDFRWNGGDAGPEDEKIPTIAHCLADETDGLYVSAETLDQLIEALQRTLGCNYFSMLRW